MLCCVFLSCVALFLCSLGLCCDGDCAVLCCLVSCMFFSVPPEHSVGVIRGQSFPEQLKRRVQLREDI